MVFVWRFVSEETGENFVESYFESREDAVYNRPDYPGYGHYELEVMPEEQAEQLVDNFDD